MTGRACRFGKVWDGNESNFCQTSSGIAGLGYTEVTVSGTGLRIIGLGDGEHIHRNQPYRATASRIETYRRASRYIVVTGSWLQGSFTTLANLDVMIDRVVVELDGAQNYP